METIAQETTQETAQDTTQDTTQEEVKPVPKLSHIVRRYMVEIGERNGLGKQISLRRFAKLLSKPLAESDMLEISHQSIHNWVKAEHYPDVRTMEMMKALTNKEMWQYQFASDMLRYMKDYPK